MSGLPDPRQWLIQQVKVMRRADADVIAAMQQARRDIAKMLSEVQGRPGVGAMVREQQLLLIKRNLMQEQSRLWRKLGNIIGARRLEAVARMIDLSKATDAFLFAGAGLGRDVAQAIADAELDAAKSGIDRMMTRMRGDSYVPLADTVYKSEVNINSRIDRMVNSALSRGLSAREFALEARNYINPNTPGGIRYAAMRLARTEINNAAHAAAVNSAQGKPWVKSMQWRLSGSHPRPDICDKLAKGGKNGDGAYPVEETPAKQHPHCFCIITPTTESEDDFLDNLVGGNYNDYLERYSPGISQRNPVR